MRPVGRLRHFDIWDGEAKARERWEAENPELAAAWNEALDIEQEREATRAQREARHSRIISAGVPERALEALSLPLQATKAMGEASTYWGEGKSFLLLSGRTGCGKTVAAVRLLVQRLDQDPHQGYGLSSLFVRAAEASRIGLFGEQAAEKIDNLKRVGLLVVDDLGAEMLTDAWRSLVDEVFDYRYARKLRTIITTNLTPEAFRERYGERIADRIRHDGRVVRCSTEESLRRMEARQ